jgi:hypothetical protein
MFFGGSSHFSSSSADSCPLDVSACADLVGSHGLSPKLPLFHSDDHAKRALEFQLSGSGDEGAFCAKPRKISTSTKRARNSRRICTSIFIGLKPAENQHLQKNADPARIGVPSEKLERRISLELFRLLQRPTCPEFRGNSEGLRAAPWFSGAPLFAPYATSGSPACNSVAILYAARSAE